MKIALCTLDDKDKVLQKYCISVGWDTKMEMLMKNIHEVDAKKEMCELISKEIIAQINPTLIYGLIDI